MKIIDKRELQTAAFGELSIGDVFYREGGHYIKVCLNGCNAVNLYNGTATAFNNGVAVFKKNATLIIGGDEDENS